jgi:hypothetical protein
MKNTRKHSLKIRIACLALFSLDCFTLSVDASPLSVVILWFCATVSLVVAIAPVSSKFSI